MPPTESIELLGDDTVFRRTHTGRRERVSASERLSALERRFLAMVTGHAALRIPIDRGVGERDLPAAIRICMRRA